MATIVAVQSPLKSQTATEVAAGGVLKLGGILFTPVGLTAVVCLCIWTLFYSRTRIDPLLPLNPFTNTDITIATYELRIFSQLTNTVLTQRVL
jgi:hypothetical protein